MRRRIPALPAGGRHAAYEAYRKRIKADPEGRANFEFAQRERFILREERRFTEVVPETFGHPASQVAS